MNIFVVLAVLILISIITFVWNFYVENVNLKLVLSMIMLLSLIATVMIVLVNYFNN